MAGGAPTLVPSAQSDGEMMLNISDVQKAGSSRLPRLIRDFYNDGSGEMMTLCDNGDALRKYRLRSRCLVDISKLNTQSSCLGHPVKFPLGIAPAGLQAMAHPDGELATSRAAAAWGINMAISTYANYAIPSIVSAGAEARNGNQAQIHHAIQLYPMANRNLMENIIRKADASGVTAIFLTGDSPVLGVRYNETKQDFRVPPDFSTPILERTAEAIQAATHEEGFNSINDPSQNWARDIPWIRARTKMQIWIKGIVTAEDVELAAVHGCDGIVVSNHGGRQLDGVPATIDALLECAPVAKRLGLGVHVDGGFRSGKDIFVALALGADCVWIGRPVLWGLAYKGQEGVEKTIEIFYEDFRRTMAMCGCVSVRDIGPHCLARMGRDGLLRKVAGDQTPRIVSSL